MTSVRRFGMIQFLAISMTTGRGLPVEVLCCHADTEILRNYAEVVFFPLRNIPRKRCDAT